MDERNPCKDCPGYAVLEERHKTMVEKLSRLCKHQHDEDTERKLYVPWRHFIWIAGAICFFIILLFEINSKAIEHIDLKFETALTAHNKDSAATRDLIIRLTTNQEHFMHYFGLKPVDSSKEKGGE